MNSDLESTVQAEWTLTDWVSIAGLLILGVFICFSIVPFGKPANHSSTHQAQPLVQASTPAAGLGSGPESTPEVSAQSVTAVTEAQARSEPAPSSTPSLGQAASSPLQPPPARLKAEKPAITDAKRANAIGKHRTNAVMRRQSSRRRSVLDKFVLKSVNTLIGLWRRAFKAKK
jgi:hypothetical protein